jgi:hypothetical protein
MPHADCIMKLQELIGCACIGDCITGDKTEISREQLAEIITSSTLWNIGRDGHNALGELIETLYEAVNGREGTMTDKQIREAIDRAKDDYPWDGSSSVQTYFGLEPLVKVAERVLEAESELPVKMPCGGCQVCKLLECTAWKYNEALSLCLPILAKYKMKVKELEDYNNLKVHYREEL